MVFRNFWVLLVALFLLFNSSESKVFANLETPTETETPAPTESQEPTETVIVSETVTTEESREVFEETTNNSDLANSEDLNQSKFRSCGISDRILGGNFWFINLRYNLICWD